MKNVLAGRIFFTIAVLLLVLRCPALGETMVVPVADAGWSRYVADQPVSLDGNGSFDPDGDAIIGYQWYQVSGPEIVIGDAQSATPMISGFVQTRITQIVEVGLVVSDGQFVSLEDTVEIIIVPVMTHETLSLINGPFRPELPTLITFGGGNGIDGIHMPLNDVWQDEVNIITGRYFHPYADQAFQIMVLLSDFAPDYRQPIQTVGFSTGGNPASIIPNIINQFFNDPRYAINRITLLDAYSNDDLDSDVAEFNAHPVAGEPAWVDIYRSLQEPLSGAFNVSFFPGGDHGTPYEWFVASAEADNWPDGDMYNQGITGGYFLSVAGPGRNMQLANDDLYYYFECPEVAVGCLRQMNAAVYPGLLPEPVTLIGPEDGGEADWRGVVLTCEESQYAASYQLLFGADSANMTTVISETPYPPEAVVDDFPFAPTYWTIRVRDDFGTTIFAPPRSIYPFDLRPVRHPARRVSSQP